MKARGVSLAVADMTGQFDRKKIESHIEAETELKPRQVYPVSTVAALLALVGDFSSTGRVLWIIDTSHAATYYVAAALAHNVTFLAGSHLLPVWLSQGDAAWYGYDTTPASMLAALSRIISGGTRTAPTPSTTDAGALPAPSATPLLLLITQLAAARGQILPPPYQPITANSPPEQAPLVSVCIPTFNRSDYLRATIASVLASDYPAASIEVIVVDDGSTGAHQAYLTELEADFSWRGPGWRVLRQHKQFASAARNRAIAHARGKYVLMFDDDDLLKPYAISMMVATAESQHAQVVVGWVQSFRNAKDQVQIAPGTRRYTWAGLGASPGLAVFGNAYGGGSALHLREALVAAGGYAPASIGMAHLDYELLGRMVTRGCTLALIPLELYDYRVASRGSIFTGTASIYNNQLFSLQPYLDAAPGLEAPLELAFGWGLTSIAQAQDIKDDL
jgi:GT2 family glycosyltransferase